MRNFLEILQKKIIVGDGAMGTELQKYSLTNEDFGGYDGCNEYLCLSKPEVVSAVHESYLAAGSDVIETNSFGSAAVVLAEYDIADQAYALSKKSAELARAAADKFETPEHPRFVAGSIGPTTKLMSLAQISYKEMYDGVMPQALGLLDGGIDLFQIETCQDILQAKTAVIVAQDAMKQLGKTVPIVLTITVEMTGTLLVGTEVLSALTALLPLGITAIGLNCATGPVEMEQHIKLLAQHSPIPIACIPNAGLPRNVGGHAVYDLSPEEFVTWQQKFIASYGVGFVGGCCGTTPEHIRQLAEAVKGKVAGTRQVETLHHVSSTFSSTTVRQDGSSPLLVGERLNSNGSKQFRDYLLSDKWEEILNFARDEANAGSHVLDVCTAYVGRPEKRDMQKLLSALRTSVTVPLMIDSTQTDVLEAGLQELGGRSIINSVNFEDGEKKFDEVVSLAKRYGAMLVALTIEEAGMAKTAAKKVEIAQRIIQRCKEKFDYSEDNLFIDPLTFTIASGDEDSRTAGLETLNAIRDIKKLFPKVQIILGLSNISFGLEPRGRQIINSVFMHEAINAGLDSAIVHAAKIMPLSRIDPKLKDVALDLIYDRRREGYDPLFVFIELMQGLQTKSGETAAQEEVRSVEEQMRQAIIAGKKIGIEKILEEALKKYSPLEIINTYLLDGMKEVGELFGRGDMQLPFVLQSAEAMKRAVSYLEQFMEKSDSSNKGVMVLATVRGDVHDIGKNLVDIILTNNGYKVINLGIKVPIETILKAYEEHKADVIGLSGLLVKSTLVMKESLELMAEQGLTVPVVCGGAALNRAYVDSELRTAYRGSPVFYAQDAFSGLKIMEELKGYAPPELTITGDVDRAKLMTDARREKQEQAALATGERAVASVSHIPTPPFWGSKIVDPKEFPLQDIFGFINKKSLYNNQWMYRRGAKSTKDFKAFLQETVEPLFGHWCNRAINEKLLAPKVVYGYYPCNSTGNEVIIYDSNDMDREVSRIPFPRQLAAPGLCLADYFEPVGNGKKDVIAFQVVTAGEVASEVEKKYYASNEYNDYLHFHGLSVETAESLAELWHRRVRHELGIAQKDSPTIEGLFRQEYQGERFSFGYPACPDLESQKYIFELLKPELINVFLSEEWQLHPEQSTSAIIVHHPDAGYFSV